MEIKKSHRNLQIRNKLRKKLNFEQKQKKIQQKQLKNRKKVQKKTIKKQKQISKKVISKTRNKFKKKTETNLKKHKENFKTLNKIFEIKLNII